MHIHRAHLLYAGLDPDDDDDNEGIDENTTPCGDPLSALQNRYEEERKALLARLHGERIYVLITVTILINEIK